jgi:hypothetical protein
MIWHDMYEIRGNKFRQEGGDNVCEEDNAFGHRRTDEVQRSREDDNIEHVIDQT